MKIPDLTEYIFKKTYEVESKSKEGVTQLSNIVILNQSLDKITLIFYPVTSLVPYSLCTTIYLKYLVESYIILGKKIILGNSEV